MVRFLVGTLSFLLVLAFVGVFAWQAFNPRERDIASTVIPDQPSVSVVENRFKIAEARLQSGFDKEAIEQLHRLTQLPEPFVPAARLLVTWIANEKLYEADPKFRDRAVVCLSILAKSGDPEARLMLAQQHWHRGNLRVAVNLLQSIVDQRPEFNLTVAQLLSALGENQQASLFAKRAVTHFQQRLRERETTDAVVTQDVQHLAQSLTLSGNRAGAIDLLASHHPGARELADHLIKLLVVDAQESMAEKPQLAFERLDQALDLTPMDINLWEQLLVLANGDSESAHLAKRRLDDGRIDAASRPSVQLAEAKREFRLGKTDLAAQHAMTSLEELECGTGIWFYAKKLLARFSLEGDEHDRQFALTLATEIVQLDPDDQEAMELLGQVLARHAREDEAIKILEAVVAGPEVRVSAIRLLADLYGKQGNRVEQGVLLARLSSLSRQPMLEPTSLNPAFIGISDNGL